MFFTYVYPLMQYRLWRRALCVIVIHEPIDRLLEREPQSVRWLARTLRDCFEYYVLRGKCSMWLPTTSLCCFSEQNSILSFWGDAKVSTLALRGRHGSAVLSCTQTVWLWWIADSDDSPFGICDMEFGRKTDITFVVFINQNIQRSCNLKCQSLYSSFNDLFLLSMLLVIPDKFTWSQGFIVAFQDRNQCT